MANEDQIRKITAQAMAKYYQGPGDLEEIVGYLFEMGIINYRSCEIAAIRSRYDFWKTELGNCREAREQTAEEFFITESKVENAVYYYTNINFKIAEPSEGKAKTRRS